MPKANPAVDVIIGLNAVIVSVTHEEPRVQVVRHAADEQGKGAPGGGIPCPVETREALPSGPFRPKDHRTLEIGLRSWVEEQTQQELGYVEQLYTFGDRGRDPREQEGGPRYISVGYLALVREANPAGAQDAAWQDWYAFFPWEDWRNGKPAVLGQVIEPGLDRWANEAPMPADRQEREERIRIAFGANAATWNEELVLDRYELLYEAGLVVEAIRDRGEESSLSDLKELLGRAMLQDHRRILATGMGRLRGKIKYRPVIFELMPPTFTLLQLQRTVEAMAGLRLHKQNFRRLVEMNGLVEGTGIIVTGTGGRPAEQFRFRSQVLMERLTPGVKLPGSRKTA